MENVLNKYAEATLEFEELNELVTSLEDATFWKRTTSRLSDLVTGRVFDYGIGYSANISRDVRKAKNIINEKLNDDVFAEVYDNLYDVPFGLTVSLPPVISLLDGHIGKMIKEIEYGAKVYTEVAGKFIHDEQYRKIPLKVKTVKFKECDSFEKGLSGIVNSYDTTTVNLGTLFGNARQSSEIAENVNRLVHKVDEDKIADVQNMINKLATYSNTINNIIDEGLYSDEMHGGLGDLTTNLANSVTSVGKAMYIIIELSKLLVVVAADIEE